MSTIVIPGEHVTVSTDYVSGGKDAIVLELMPDDGTRIVITGTPLDFVGIGEAFISLAIELGADEPDWR